MCLADQRGWHHFYSSQKIKPVSIASSDNHEYFIYIIFLAPIGPSRRARISAPIRTSRSSPLLSTTATTMLSSYSELISCLQGRVHASVRMQTCRGANRGFQHASTVYRRAGKGRRFRGSRVRDRGTLCWAFRADRGRLTGFMDCHKTARA